MVTPTAYQNARGIPNSTLPIVRDSVSILDIVTIEIGQ